MEKLTEVENATALMDEAMTWSVMKWLREKKRVRKTADQANAVLDQVRQAVQDHWSESQKAAYEAATVEKPSSGVGRCPRQPSLSIGPELIWLAKKVKDADDEAYQARMDAETTFDEAEKQLSTSLAREGCRKAIHSWELHQKAIRKAEALETETSS